MAQLRVNVNFIAVFLILAFVIVAGLVIDSVFGGLSISLGGVVALVQLVLTYIIIKQRT